MARPSRHLRAEKDDWLDQAYLWSLVLLFDHANSIVQFVSDANDHSQYRRLDLAGDRRPQ